MKVDATGLVATTQRLANAVEGLSAGGVAHPPLAADPASLGAAARLSTASTELGGALGAHVVALVTSLEFLTGVALTFTATDENNAAAIAAVDPGAAAAAPVAGAPATVPDIPADVRAPIPPAALSPEALSAGTHAAAPVGGEGFAAAWSPVGAAAREAASSIRAAVGWLPDVLDTPASSPEISSHLLDFADGLDAYADRAGGLVAQSSSYNEHLISARDNIPSPAQLTAAQQRVTTLTSANASSGGRFAVPLAGAVAQQNQLKAQTMSNYSMYHTNVSAATKAADNPSNTAPKKPKKPVKPPVPRKPGKPKIPDPAAGIHEPQFGGAPGQPVMLDPNAQGSPESSGELAGMLPQMLGAAGGMVGGLMGAVMQVPQSAMQALGSITKGLGGLAQSKPDLDPKQGDPGAGSGSGDPAAGSDGGGGGAPTSPAGGAGAGALGVAPSTGAPPTPAVTPAGAESADSPPGRGGAGGMPMGGMPMGGLGGAPGGDAGHDEAARRKLRSRNVPHAEDVTGRVDTNRLSASAAGTRETTSNPGDEPPPDPPPPSVRRRVVTHSPEGP